MADWGMVRSFALKLPEVTERDTKFFVLDKQFAWPWLKRIAPKKPRVPCFDILAVRVKNEAMKVELITEEPDIFFTEPHYNGYPAILVRLDKIEFEELAQVLQEGWRAQAPAKLILKLDASA